jgi:uncharacterized membrane protein YvlD (DUF360 family)
VLDQPEAALPALRARLIAGAPQIWAVGQWFVSLWSLVLGLLTLLVFRRGLPNVGWIVGYLLLVWLVFAALTELRARLEERGRRFVVGASEYAIQTLYHNLLLFVLPAYYAAATLDSPNGIFFAAVVASALLTAVDPLYRRLVQPRPWLQHGMFGFSVFSALNVALPLVGVQPFLSLEGSAALAAMALTPAFRRPGRVSWAGAGARAAMLACLALIAAWCGRALVPPAPLFVARSTAAREVSGLEPVNVIGASTRASTVAQWGSLAAYTAVYAPSGLHQPIAHVWSRNGAPLARIPLSPVLGGRADGFRTYSVVRNLRPPLAGRYTVDVVTASGQLIGRLRFALTP